ncbi:hypothetical protein DFH07DRAFT_986083 [Mycena maculata]|uniref:Zn(2)-C6 fungal-type domain-containing protein n=1 Tax=Mycena maculata TaxID=230809 RepID=A0AAD7I733_9AGAR|nr:hypothetical protein DFH07DRAFT_986083 [Mycena maculata]
MEAPKPKRIRPPKPRTQPLRRGQACLNCRHLKIRCDGIRPVCGKCTSVPKDEPCTYMDAASTMPESMHFDSRLDYGHGENVSRPSTWHGYESPVVEFSPPTSLFGDRPYGNTPDETGSEYSFGDLEIQVWKRKPEPRLETIRVLLDYFIPNAVQFGFFLHLERFRNAALLPSLLFGSITRPAVSLLYAAYLWGAHFSQSNSLVELKPTFLRRALQYVSIEICADRDANHSLQTIQAQVLLSNYFFIYGRFHTAHVYANGAATLALGYQLHKLGTSPSLSSPMLDVHGNSCPLLVEQPLTQSQSALEEGERIRCFWAVVSLQTKLNLAVDCPISISSCILEVVGMDISTPWPMQIADYEIRPCGIHTDAHVGDTIKRFLMDDLQYSGPTSTVQAQASILLHRASRLEVKWSSNLQATEHSTYMACYTWLDTRISRFWQALPPVYQSADPELVGIHILTAAASLRANRGLCAVDPEAQKKCIRAARAILRSGNTAASELSRPQAEPVYAPICAMACRVLVGEIQSARMVRSDWAQALNIAVAPCEEDESLLGVELHNGMMVLASCAAKIPLAGE